jgi:hypothetical protein
VASGAAFDVGQPWPSEQVVGGQGDRVAQYRRGCHLAIPAASDFQRLAKCAFSTACANAVRRTCHSHREWPTVGDRGEATLDCPAELVEPLQVRGSLGARHPLPLRRACKQASVRRSRRGPVRVPEVVEGGWPAWIVHSVRESRARAPPMVNNARGPTAVGFPSKVTLAVDTPVATPSVTGIRIFAENTLKLGRSGP